jgi:phospholipid/cholesterol/gamma-HCH transport system ATP-binding protein
MAVEHRWRKEHPNQPLLEFSGVSFADQDRVILDNISFKVSGGETRILLGRNGAGKSLIMKLANGLLKPDEGIVRVFGKDLNCLCGEDLFALRQDIGMVFQEGALFDSLSVRDNVAYQLEENHVSKAEIETRVLEVLRFVGLDGTIDTFPPELSGGMQRRVAVARALISNPELLLYDSPTGGLDPVTSEMIIELVIKQRDVHGSSCLLVTERLIDAFTCATHYFDEKTENLMKLPDGEENINTTFLVLNERKICFDGSTFDLVRSKDRFIVSFLE